MRSEVRADSLQCENNIVVGSPEEVFGMGQPNCGSTACVERLEELQGHFFVCFGLQGNMQLEQLQSGA